MKPTTLRSLSLLLAAAAATLGQANLLTFDGQGVGASVGDAYLASDGVSFANGEFLSPVYNAPTPAGVLFDEGHDTITMNGVASSFVNGVSLFYASNSVASGIAASLSVYAGANGTGSLLGSLFLADSPNPFNQFVGVTLPFVGNAKSVVLTGAANHILYDNLSFSPAPVPEPSACAALGVGALALLRRRRRA